MTAPACQCEALDARACLVSRIPEPMLLTGEICGCECHGDVPAGVPVLHVGGGR